MRRLLVAAGVAVLVSVPLLADPFQTTLVARGMVWGILGLAVWLLLRVSNLPSFGHAAFFGVAAYTAGLAVTQWQINNLFAALGLSIGITCLVALPIALVTSRLQSISFLLVTLAFAEMLHSLALRWRAVGGSDGLVGVVRPDAWPLPIELVEPTSYFYVVLGVLLVSAGILLVVVRSPFGAVLAGLRESEPRMSALGYNPAIYRVAAFVLSAGIAGAAGVMHTYLNRFANPEDLGALVSARGLLVVVIGGAALWGAPVAAIVLTVVEDVLSTQTERWLAAIGLLYVVVALLPSGRGAIAAARAALTSPLARRRGRTRPAEERL